MTSRMTTESEGHHRLSFRNLLNPIDEGEPPVKITNLLFDSNPEPGTNSIHRSLPTPRYLQASKLSPPAMPTPSSMQSPLPHITNFPAMEPWSESSTNPTHVLRPQSLPTISESYIRVHPDINLAHSPNALSQPYYEGHLNSNVYRRFTAPLSLNHLPQNRLLPAITSYSGHESPAHSRSCANCGTRETPSWRRCGPNNIILCNACGLYYNEHKRHRQYRIHSDGRTRAVRSTKHRLVEGEECPECRAQATTQSKQLEQHESKELNAKSACGTCKYLLNQRSRDLSLVRVQKKTTTSF